jgi:phospholipid transport system substrate-binding protein
LSQINVPGPALGQAGDMQTQPAVPCVRQFRYVALAALLAAGLAARAAPVEPTNSPEQVVRDTAEKVMAEVRARAEELTRNPDSLYLLVEEQVAPRFDVPFIAQQVLGRYWSQATPEQRARFTAAFQSMLIRTYAHGLLAYRDEPFEWYPLRTAPDAGDVLVKSSLGSSEGLPMAVNYRVHLRDGEWRVYDISIDGISLIVNYRGMFAQRLRKQGLDALIGRMESRAAAR